MSDKKLYRLWVTFPNEELRDHFKKLLTKDFGSSGHGIMSLLHFYDKPHLAVNMGDVRHVKEMLQNTNSNNAKLLELKNRLDEIEAEIAKEMNFKKGHSKNKKEEIMEDKEYEY